MLKKITTTTEELHEPVGTLRISVSLLTRLLEWAKEEAKTDVEIHKAVEKMAELILPGKTLTMDEFLLVIPGTLVAPATK